MKKSIYALLVTIGFLLPQLSIAQTLSDGEALSSCLSLVSNNLTYGAYDATTGGEVSMLQDFLIVKGFLTTSIGGPTGYYGSLTVQAVKAYQASKGFAQVGTVGPLTKAAIASDTNCSTTSANTTNSASSTSATNNSTLPSFAVAAPPYISSVILSSTGSITVYGSTLSGVTSLTYTAEGGTISGGVVTGILKNIVSKNDSSVTFSPDFYIANATLKVATFRVSRDYVVSNSYRYVYSDSSGTTTATSNALPVVTLTSSTSTVVSGGMARITWSATPSASVRCVAAGGNLAAGLTINPSGEWLTPPLYTTTQYGIMCTNTTNGLVSYKYVTVNVAPLLQSSSTSPTISFSNIGKDVIPAGTATTLQWSVTPIDGVSCIAAGGNLAAGQPIGTVGQWNTPNLYTTTQYGIKCTNSFGQSSYKYLTVNVSEASASPTVLLTESSASTVSGSPYTLTLSSFNTTSCSVTYTGPDGGGSLSNGPTSGILNLSTAIAGTYTAAAVCKTASGSTIQSNITHLVTTTSNTAPTIIFTSNSSMIAYGGKATITWKTDPSTGVTCVAAGGNLAAGTSINNSGTWETPALYSSVTYGIQCKNTSNNLVSYKYVTVNVSSPSTSTASTNAPTITLTPDLTVAFGGTATLSWNVSPNINVICGAASGASSPGTNIGTTGYYVTPKLYTTTTYGVKCTDNGTGLTSYKYVKVSVLEQDTADAPTITFTTSSTTISFGGTATLKWSTSPSTNVVCAAAGGNLAAGSRIDPSGSWVTPPLYSTTQYGIGCTNTVNNLASYKYVTVNVAQQASQTAAPVVTTKGSGTISYGGTATVSWSVVPSTNVSCVAAGGELPSGTPIATSGTWTTSKLYTTTQYVIRCRDNSTNLTGYGYITITVPTQGNADTSSSIAMGGIGTVLGISTLACIDLPYNMYRGFESNSVTTLQTFLVSKGLLHDNPTGFYGDITVAAVKEYQSMKGLPVTGMVYDFTRAAIKEDTCQ